MKKFFIISLGILSVGFLQAQTGSLKGLDIDLTNYTYSYRVQFITVLNQQQHLQMAYMDVAPTTTANSKTVLLLNGKNFNGPIGSKLQLYWQQKDTG